MASTFTSPVRARQGDLVNVPKDFEAELDDLLEAGKAHIIDTATWWMS